MKDEDIITTAVMDKNTCNFPSGTMLFAIVVSLCFRFFLFFCYSFNVGATTSHPPPLRVRMRGSPLRIPVGQPILLNGTRRSG